MGTGMAGQLLNHGYPVTVYNRSLDKTEALARIGARVASSPRLAVADCSVVISMLSDDSASRGVWMGPDGVMSGVREGTTLIESSTVSPKWIEELSAAAQAHQCLFLDAPVSGSKPQANAGELIFFVGGPADLLESVRPVLQSMSKQIVHLGPIGSGAKMKLINNFMSAVQAVALAEAIVTIEKLGLDRDAAVGILTSGAPGSPFVKTSAARMLTKNFEPNFMLKWMAKDMRYANEQAGGMDICEAVIRTLQRAVEAGYGDRDFSAMIESVRNK